MFSSHEGRDLTSTHPERKREPRSVTVSPGSRGHRVLTSLERNFQMHPSGISRQSEGTRGITPDTWVVSRRLEHKEFGASAIFPINRVRRLTSEGAQIVLMATSLPCLASPRPRHSRPHRLRLLNPGHPGLHLCIDQPNHPNRWQRPRGQLSAAIASNHV